MLKILLNLPVLSKFLKILIVNYYQNPRALHEPRVFTLFYEKKGLEKILFLLKKGLNIDVQNFKGENLLYCIYFLFQHQRDVLKFTDKEIFIFIDELLKMNISFIYSCDKDENIISKNEYFAKGSLIKRLMNESSDNTDSCRKGIFWNLFAIHNSYFYNYLISNEHVHVKVKAWLEIKNLFEISNLLFFDNYYNFKKTTDKQDKWLEEVDKIIDREIIFSNKVSTLYSLSFIFGSNAIFDSLSNSRKIICFEVFDKLNFIGKSIILKQLLKSHQEEILFNLISLGYVNLKKQNLYYKNKPKQLFVFELFRFYSFTKHLLTSDTFNIQDTDDSGNNFFYFMGTFMYDKEILHLIQNKVSSLSCIDKAKLLNQKNNHDISPLYCALKDLNESLLTFLIDNGVNPVELQCIQYLEFLMDDRAMDQFHYDWLDNLYIQWMTSYRCQELNKKLPLKKITEKSIQKI